MAIMPANVIVMYPSRIKWIVAWLILGLIMTLSLFLSITCILAGAVRLSWMASLEIGLVVAPPPVWAFILFCMIHGLIRNAPRLEIGPDGFVVRPVLGRNRSRHWTDIEGDFSARFIPGGRAVIYRLSEPFKTSHPDVAKSALAGGQELLQNWYGISTAGLAELLNEHKRQAVGLSQSVFTR